MKPAWNPEIDSKARARIGQLVRDGKTVYYAILQGGYKVEHEEYAEVFAYVQAEESALAKMALGI